MTHPSTDDPRVVIEQSFKRLIAKLLEQKDALGGTAIVILTLQELAERYAWPAILSLTEPHRVAPWLAWAYRMHEHDLPMDTYPAFYVIQDQPNDRHYLVIPDAYSSPILFLDKWGNLRRYDSSWCTEFTSTVPAASPDDVAYSSLVRWAEKGLAQLTKGATLEKLHEVLSPK